ncbi:Na/Pi symporter [Ekhidna sp.]|uniref:Na/Pi symporter n=1 Tax=Ekhidna sp. TaxID=2608089 RepID=UPI0032ECE44D
MIGEIFLSSDVEKNNYQSILSRTLVIGVSILLFLLSIELMGLSIAKMAEGWTNSISRVTENPFVGLFIGLLSTALLQSSSTTTSIAVAAVASSAISLENAIPIVIGANIGTTITSTIISMSYISKQKEFRKAVAAGTSHDFFNILTVLILFPLEVNYRFLERISAYISSSLHVGGSIQNEIVASSSFIETSTEWFVSAAGPIISLLAGILLLFGCIKFISKWLYKILIGKTKDRFENVVFKNKYRAFGWGLVITSIAQSSSLTTSIIVPLVATGKVKIKKAFQFIMGANIGTTITALLAAIFQSEAAISLAIVHFLFNLTGVMIFFLIPFMSEIPVYLAKKMGKLTMRVRLVGFAYILIAFFLLPFTLIYFSESAEKSPDTVEILSED